jgi:hypothetical protein
MMPNDPDLDQENIGISRLDAEWSVLVALRETVNTALRGVSSATYKQSLQFGKVLIPELLGDSSLLAQEFQSETAKEYIQRAEAKSEMSGNVVDPTDLMEEEIKELQTLLRANTQSDKIRQRLGRLEKAVDELRSELYSENQIIIRDALTSNREYPISGRGKDYTEFVLPNDRVLRIRVLHPGRPEHIIGADVIYESYVEKKKLVRIAALQYKMWSGKTLSLDERAVDQLEKLETHICGGKFCESNISGFKYRLPNCAAFFRPTNKLQSADARLISNGHHIPICVVRQNSTQTNSGGLRISSSAIDGQYVTQKVFEELFNHDMLGSKFITYDELAVFYRNAGIFDPSQRVIIHAQDFQSSVA